jgi:uncharacterized lipoprotein YddW (UPF0748 family)
MDRRRFIVTVSRAAATLGLLPAGSIACFGSESSREFRVWAWVHGNRERKPEEWLEHFSRLGDAGISGVLVSGNGEEPIEAAGTAGLAFHRWIWTLNRNGDAWVKENHPEWFTVSREGKSSLEHPPYVGYYKWVCPTRPPVREYLKNVVDRVATTPGVDGVHLDYIRQSDVILPVGLWSRYDLVQDQEYAEFDFCYCDVCRETFSGQTGKDPLDLPDTTQDVEWREFRWNSLTELVTVLADTVRARGKSVSAAVFPTPTLARRLVRQAWEQWPLDAVFPMIYHEFYNEPVSWIAAATAEGVGAVDDNTPLYSGLYLPQLSPEQLREAVVSARQAGAAGVSFFESGRLSDEHVLLLKEALSY